MIARKSGFLRAKYNEIYTFKQQWWAGMLLEKMRNFIFSIFDSLRLITLNLKRYPTSSPKHQSDAKQTSLVKFKLLECKWSKIHMEMRSAASIRSS